MKKVMTKEEAINGLTKICKVYKTERHKAELNEDYDAEADINIPMSFQYYLFLKGSIEILSRKDKDE